LINYCIPEDKVEEELQFEFWLLDDRDRCKSRNKSIKARNTECSHKISACVSYYMLS